MPTTPSRVYLGLVILGSFLPLLANATHVAAQVVNFAPAVAYGSGGFGATSVAVADVNGDGKPDLLVANTCTSYGDCYNGTVGVLLGNGDGTFQPAVTYPSGGYGADFIAVADVNRDGKPDLIVAHQCVSYSLCATPFSVGAVGVLLGNGDGTFRPALTYDSGGYLGVAVAVADVNGDGKPDLLASNWCASYTTACGTGTVGVLLGNGDGTFQPAATYGFGGYNQFGDTPELVVLALADVNGDGKPDLLVPNQCASSADCNNGTVGVLLGNGDGTFQPAVTYDSGGSSAVSVAVTDVNGDGKPDLLVANNRSHSVGVLLGNGDGTFRTAVSYYSGEQTLSVTAGDVNGDGKPDLVVPQYSPAVGEPSEVAVLLGNGDGTFQPYMPDLVFPSGGYAAAQATIADVNGDGKPDLVVVNETPNPQGVYNGVVGVLINASGLVAPTSLVSSLNPSAVDQPVTYTATVSGHFGEVPTGSVTFAISGNKPVAYQLTNGQATFTWAFSNPGARYVTAAYSGDANYPPSMSARLTQTVNPAVVSIAGSPQQPLTKNGSGNYVAMVTVTNTGNVTVSSLQVTIAGTTLGSGSLMTTPPSVTNLAPGASAVVTLTFPASSVSPGATASPLKVSGTYSVRSVPLNGNWALSFRSVSL